METGLDIGFIGRLIEIIIIDLMLSGDNAVVIAMACRNLPPQRMRQAIFLGSAAAIGIRIVLTAAMTLLLDIPYLRIVGGVLLLVIAVKLLADDDGEEQVPEANSMWAAIRVVLVADAVMSFDNMVAVAVTSEGSLFLLAFGLLVSMSILMYGSRMVAVVMNRYPATIAVGAALLGWIGGGIIVTDPAIADLIAEEFPTFIFSAPLTGAIFVLLAATAVNARRGEKAEAVLAIAAPIATIADVAAGEPVLPPATVVVESVP
jgi:YjbE family integral membrane protein